MNTKIKLTEKEDYLCLLKKINEPLINYFSKGKTRIQYVHTGVGYGNEIAQIEGFSRFLLGVGPCLKDLDNQWEILIYEGIKNGTNPLHDEYWGDIGNTDQRMVEMPSIALALYYNNHFLWNKFNNEEKQRIYQWFSQIFIYECPDGNWQFFKVLVGVVFKKFGFQVNDEYIAKPLEKIEKCYQNNGWYNDSSRGRRDYYNAFSFHYYGLIYSVLEPNSEESQEFKKRASIFAKDYIYFFSEEGANIPFGRSMIYRHAVISFWTALIYAQVYPFELGIMKGIINRNIKWWLNNQIFDNSGILTIGYTYPQLMLSEQYNSTLSPYWSNKLFIILALPENHEFWKCKEEALPRKKSMKELKALNMIAQTDEQHSVLLNGGQEGPNYHSLTNEKYLKFAYSSHFGFSVPRSNQLKEEAAMDSMLGLQKKDTKILVSKGKRTIEEVGQFFVRNKVKDISLLEGVITSTWNPTESIEVRTSLVDFLKWQIRVHQIKTDSEIILYETGFAIENTQQKENKFNIDNNSNFFNGICGFSGIVSLYTNDLQKKQCPVNCLPNTNIMTWEVTCLPGIEYILDSGEGLIVTGIYAHPNSCHAKNIWMDVPDVEVQNNKIIITCKDKYKEIPLNKNG